jgi:hypothetical protein
MKLGHGQEANPGMTRVSRWALTAVCAALCGCGSDSVRYQGVSPFFSKQFQSLKFAPERPKDKYETTTQYEEGCAKRLKDNAELIVSKAKQLAGASFVAAVPATVGEYDADKGHWKVSASIQEGTPEAGGTGADAKQPARTLDDRYWCSIVLGDVSADAEKSQGQVTVLAEKTLGKEPRRVQSLSALIAAAPEKAKAMAKDIPEKQSCELWLYVQVLGVDLPVDKTTPQAGPSSTPSESSMVCTPKIRIGRIELRRKDGHKSYVWSFTSPEQPKK